ncbi:ganglioside-induced differentiation-associated protein 1-like [Tubulanus polymorphus]|uniref:ganglioside-induced differentiation-associated protein 1-like n=1 Tax=Tubulanus polymorphus TaxID=672921 RepID=UPI003DA31D74
MHFAGDSASNTVKYVQLADFSIHYQPFDVDSQKVLLGLEELGLLCGHMNIIHGWSRYDCDYLSFVTDGKIPVLFDGAHLISDTQTILHHIDNTAAACNSAEASYQQQQQQIQQVQRRLFPESHTIEGQRVKHFTELLENISLELIQYGSIKHPSAGAQSGAERKQLRRLMSNCAFKKIKGFYDNRRQKLEFYREKNPEFEQIYEKLIKNVKKINGDCENCDKLLKHLEILQKVFDEIEKELQHRQKEFEDREFWLITGFITNADLSLAVVLSTLHLFGFSSNFWSREKRPFLNRYFNKLYKRRSFYNSCIWPYTRRGAVLMFIRRRPTIVISLFTGFTILSTIAITYLWYYSS